MTPKHHMIAHDAYGMCQQAGISTWVENPQVAPIKCKKTLSDVLQGLAGEYVAVVFTLR